MKIIQKYLFYCFFEIKNIELIEKWKMRRISTACKSRIETYANDNVENIKDQIDFLYTMKDIFNSCIMNMYSNQKKALK